MPGGVPRVGTSSSRPSPARSTDAGNGPISCAVEVDQRRLEPLAATAAADSRGRGPRTPVARIPLQPVHEHPCMREGVHAADVICVQMGEHDRADGTGSTPIDESLAVISSRGRELEPRQPEEGVPAREPSRRRSPRRLARVEEVETGRVLDQEGVDGQRLVAPIVEDIPANPSCADLGPDVARDQTDDAH